MAERVLVTGGTGFIAGHTIAALLAAGYRVRASVRSREGIATIEAALEGLGAGGDLEFAEVDLNADDGWAAAAAGCSGLFHMASPFPPEIPADPGEVIRPAVDGTLRALGAAASEGIGKSVVTSSVAAVCYGRGGRDHPFTEEDWTDPDGDDVTPYVRSKTLAERAAWDFVGRDAPDMALSVINPGLVLGPLTGRTGSTSVEVIRKMLAGEMPAAPRIGFSIVDVRDVADLHVRAYQNEAATGQRFLCADRWMWLKEIGAVIRDAYPDVGARAPVRELPGMMVRMAAAFDRSVGLILNELDQTRMVDSTRARTVLGWTPRPADEAIRATVAGLVDLGMV